MENVTEPRTEELQEQNTVEQPAETVATAAEEVIENNTPAYQIPDTKEEIVARITEIAKSGDAGSRIEQDQLKQAFYKLQREERTAAQTQFVENGGDPQDFTPEEDPLEEEMKAQLNAYTFRQMI